MIVACVWSRTPNQHNLLHPFQSVSLSLSHPAYLFDLLCCAWCSTVWLYYWASMLPCRACYNRALCLSLDFTHEFSRGSLFSLLSQGIVYSVLQCHFGLSLFLFFVPLSLVLVRIHCLSRFTNMTRSRNSFSLFFFFYLSFI